MNTRDGVLVRRLLEFLAFVICVPLASEQAAAAVGTIQAAVDVTPTRLPSYSFPIDVTPGIVSMTPRLSVAYAGPLSRSIVGVGFNVAGLSSITACPRTLAQDGIRKAVQLDSTDRYCLDGARLRVIVGTYGQSESVYRTELDRLARITAKNSLNGRPGYFTVEAADGLIYEYGSDPNSQYRTNGPTTPVLIWALTRIRDRSGNSILFWYENDATADRFRPDYVRYTDNATVGNGHYVVDFVYQGSDRPDPIDENYPSTLGDGSKLETRLLDRIELKHDSAVYRQYRFQYSSGAGTNSRLSSVQQCAATTSDCFPATTFTWQSGSTGHAILSATSVSVPNANAFPLDYNGDGYEDLVWSSGTTWWRMSGSASGYTTAVNTGVASTNPTKARVLDWNGDGRMDLLIDWSDSKFRVLQGTPTGLASPVAAGTGGIPSNAANSYYWVADMNGDGRDDLLRAITTVGAVHAIWARYSSATGFGAETQVVQQVGPPWFLTTSVEPFDQYGVVSRNEKRRLDFNGDGLEDLIVRACEWDGETPCAASGWYVVLSRGTTYEFAYVISTPMAGARPATGDFNNDGLSDVAFACGSYWCVGFGNGDGPLQVVQGYTNVGYRQYSYLAADYDGDGYDDLYVSHVASNTWHVLRSSGNGLSLSGYSQTGISSNGGAWATTDLNGDGLVDIARYDLSTFQWGYHLRAGLPADRLSGATDGLGNGVAYTYQPMSSASIYTKGATATYPVRDYQGTEDLVASLQISPAGGTAFSMNYSYGGARIEPLGRGFLGMGSMNVVDGRQNGLNSSYTYNQTFPYIGAVSTSTIKQSDGTVVSSTSNTYAHHVLDGTANNQRYLPYLQQSVQNDYEVQGTKNGQWITQTTLTQTLNTLGNVTSASQATVDKDLGSPEYGTTHTSSINATYLEDQQNWCLAVPTSRSETRTLPNGTTETRSVGFVASGTSCRVTQQTIEPSAGSAISLVTDVNYDACGNVSSRSSYPAGQPANARTTTYGYLVNGSTRCELPITETNPLNETTTSAYDYQLGLVTSSTDANGLATIYEYDVFGRIARVKRPDNTATRVALAACDAGNAYCGKDNTVRVSVTKTARATTDAVVRTDASYLDGLGRERYSHRDTLESGTAIVESQYDAFGRVIQRSQPRYSTGSVYWTTFVYDRLGRLTEENSPISNVQTSGRITRYAYEGRDTKRTDPRGNTTTNTSNVLGALIRIQDPSPGGTTSLTYRPFGERASITDAAGNVTSWSYNIRGFVTGVSDPDSGSWSSVPNAFGEIASQTDAKSQLTSFTYDKLSRLLTRAETEGTTTWVWGQAADNTSSAKYIGRLKSVSSPGGYAELNTYDGLGRLTQRRVTADLVNYFVDSTYDTLTGNLATLQYPTSTSNYRLKLGYEYQSGELKRVRDANGTTVFWEAVSTDAWGHLQSENYGNGVSTYSEFDQANGLMFKRQGGLGGGTGLLDALVQWDYNGNLTTRQDLKLGVTETFSYDALNRLDYSQRNGATNLDLTLDAIGNITYKSDVGNYSYHATKRRAVLTAGSNTYGYDANGNMTSRNGSTITYTSYNLPSFIASGANSSAIYYGASRDRYKQVAVTAGTTETTLYIAGLLEVATKGGVTEYRHSIGAGSSTVALYTRRSSGSPAVDTYYVHRDHLGSPELVTNSSGAAVVRLSFGAFGGRRDAADWEGPISAQDSTLVAGMTRRGFTGHEHLDNVVLIHMNGRVFDPNLGRFLSADPVVGDEYNSQSWNRYAYVANGPLSFTDPTGYVTDTCGGGTIWACTHTEGPSGGGVGGSSSDSDYNDWTGGGVTYDSLGNPVEATVERHPYRDFWPSIEIEPFNPYDGQLQGLPGSAGGAGDGGGDGKAGGKEQGQDQEPAECRFMSRVNQRFKDINSALPGILAVPGMGLITAGKVGEATGLPTFGDFLVESYEFGRMSGSAELVLYFGAINFLVAGGSFEAGLYIGSAWGTAIDDLDHVPLAGCP